MRPPEVTLVRALSVALLLAAPIARPSSEPPAPPALDVVLAPHAEGGVVDRIWARASISSRCPPRSSPTASRSSGTSPRCPRAPAASGAWARARNRRWRQPTRSPTPSTRPVRWRVHPRESLSKRRRHRVLQDLHLRLRHQRRNDRPRSRDAARARDGSQLATSRQGGAQRHRLDTLVLEILAR